VSPSLTVRRPAVPSFLDVSPVVRGTSAGRALRARNAELEPDSICRAGRHRVSGLVGKLVADDPRER
jgi:hypothetical protein